MAILLVLWQMLTTAASRLFFLASMNTWEMLLAVVKHHLAAVNLGGVFLGKSKSGFPNPKTDFAFSRANPKTDHQSIKSTLRLWARGRTVVMVNEPFFKSSVFLVVKYPYDLRSQIRFWILPNKRTLALRPSSLGRFRAKSELYCNSFGLKGKPAFPELAAYSFRMLSSSCLRFCFKFCHFFRIPRQWQQM